MTRGIKRGRPLWGEVDGSNSRVVLVSQDLIVDFARRWYLFGGGDAVDIMTQFGWTTVKYFIELEAILRDSNAEDLPHEVRESMIRLCRERLAAGG